MIARLLKGQRADGGFGVHPYSKWRGAHWRLVSLVELGVAKTNAAARAAAGDELRWIASPRWQTPSVIRGLERRHASIEGNALAVACRLGMAKDIRVGRLVEVLLRSQWPDGGWNCDRHPSAHHSSFHETLAPIWGLFEYYRARLHIEPLLAARRAAEFLLDHRLFRSSTTGKVIDPEWQQIHWPHYWHYDFFHGLRVIAMLGLLTDPRAGDAIELLLERRHPDGSWHAGGRRYWTPSTEVVEWGDAHQIITPTAIAIVDRARCES